MKIPCVHVDRSILYSLLLLLLAILVSLYSYPSRFCPYPFCPRDNHDFIQCLHDWEMSDIIYTKRNSLYPSILNANIYDLRFASPSTPKPFLIVVAEHDLHVQGVVRCSRKHGISLRIRGGGHDYEGLSYATSQGQGLFVVIDLFKMNRTLIDVGQRTAWVQAGTTLGQLYNEISKVSQTLAFPAGFCSGVGVGGQFSGGGFGELFRKYGLAADNIIDARVVDATGQIFYRETMDEDLFWAIRGGGGGSFGVVTSWKVNLVSVPQVVTTFSTSKTLEQNAVSLILRWQNVAPNLPDEMYCDVIITNPGKTIVAKFDCIFLGGADELLGLFAQEFPELGATREDCIEGSWIQSLLWLNGYKADDPTDVLAGKVSPVYPRSSFYSKSDFVTKPITRSQLEGLFKILYQFEFARLHFIPMGGIMNDIAEDALPYPHRKGNLFHILYQVKWDKAGTNATYIKWIREIYDYMAPYVSSNPRRAYVNFRDLDLGVNTRDGSPAGTYGYNYFKNNFKRLVEVKNKVDPTNFFWHEQSIPLKVPDMVEE